MKAALQALLGADHDAKSEAYAALLQAVREDDAARLAPQVPDLVDACAADVAADGPSAPAAYDVLGYICQHCDLRDAMDPGRVDKVLGAVAGVLANTGQKKHHSLAARLLGAQTFPLHHLGAERDDNPCGRTFSMCLQSLVASACGPAAPGGQRALPLGLTGPDPGWEDESPTCDLTLMHGSVLATLEALLETDSGLMAERSTLWLPYVMELLLFDDTNSSLCRRTEGLVNRVLDCIHPPHTPQSLAKELDDRMQRVYVPYVARILSGQAPECSPTSPSRAVRFLGLCALLDTQLQHRASLPRLNRLLALLERALTHRLPDLRREAFEAWRLLICNVGRVRKAPMAMLLMRPIEETHVRRCRDPGLQAAMYAAWCQLAAVGLEVEDAYCRTILEAFLSVSRVAEHPGLRRQLRDFVTGLWSSGQNPPAEDCITVPHVDSDGVPVIGVPPVACSFAPSLLPLYLRFVTDAPPEDACGLWPPICRWAAGPPTAPDPHYSPPPFLLDAVRNTLTSTTLRDGCSSVASAAVAALAAAFPATADDLLTHSLRVLFQATRDPPPNPPLPPDAVASVLPLATALFNIAMDVAPQSEQFNRLAALIPLVCAECETTAGPVGVGAWLWLVDRLGDRLAMWPRNPTARVGLLAARNRRQFLSVLAVPLYWKHPSTRHTGASADACDDVWRPQWVVLWKGLCQLADVSPGTPNLEILQGEWCDAVAALFAGVSECPEVDLLTRLRGAVWMGHRVARLPEDPPAASGQLTSRVLHAMDDSSDSERWADETAGDHSTCASAVCRFGNLFVQLAQRIIALSAGLPAEDAPRIDEVALPLVQLLEALVREVSQSPSMGARTHFLLLWAEVHGPYFQLFKMYRHRSAVLPPDPLASRVYAHADAILPLVFSILKYSAPSRPVYVIPAGHTEVSTSALCRAFSLSAPWLMTCFHSQVLHVINVAVTFWNASFGSLTPSEFATLAIDPEFQATLLEMATQSTLRIPSLSHEASPAEKQPLAKRALVPEASQTPFGLQSGGGRRDDSLAVRRRAFTVPKAPLLPATRASSPRPSGRRGTKRRLFAEAAAPEPPARAFVVVDAARPKPVPLSAMTDRQREAWEARGLGGGGGVLSLPPVDLTPSLPPVELMEPIEAAPQPQLSNGRAALPEVPGHDYDSPVPQPSPANGILNNDEVLPDAPLAECPVPEVQPMLLDPVPPATESRAPSVPEPDPRMEPPAGVQQPTLAVPHSDTAHDDIIARLASLEALSEGLSDTADLHTVPLHRLLRTQASLAALQGRLAAVTLALCPAPTDSPT